MLLLVLEAQGVATQGVGGRWRACCCPCWWAVVLAGVVHQGLAVLGAIALHLAARGASGGRGGRPLLPAAAWDAGSAPPQLGE